MMGEEKIIEMIYVVFILCLGITIGFTTNMGYGAYLLYPFFLILGYFIAYFLS